MLTQLSDVIIPSIYEGYGFVPSPETFAFLNSPAVRQSAYLNTVANREGVVTTIPFWNDLDASADPNISTDSPNDIAVPQKIAASALQIRIADYNNAWSAADLVAKIAGSDPMAQIKAITNLYWDKQVQKFLASIARGIADSNIANNNGDMVNNIAVQTNTAPGPTNKFSHNSFIDSQATAGEFFTNLEATIMPMTVYFNMVKQDAITFTTPSSQGVLIPQYGGKPVLRVADALMSRMNATTGQREYITMFCGAGCFAYGQGTPKIPVEVKREALQGNGAGIEILVERKRWIFAASGHSMLGAAVVGQSPTSAEWGKAANWLRKVGRNNVALAYLISNG